MNSQIIYFFLMIFLLYLQQWQWNLGSIAIFFAWMDLVLFVQKVPRFGIYVVMITDILYTFIQFAIVFLLIIVAFAFGFYALLQSRVSLLYSSKFRIIKILPELLQRNVFLYLCQKQCLCSQFDKFQNLFLCKYRYIGNI